MIPRWLPLALSIVLLWPVVLHAQVGPKFQTPKLVEAFNSNSAVEVNNDKMYEDIEILRRILDRKLQPLYQRVQYTTSKPVWVDLGFPMPTNTSPPNIALLTGPYDASGVWALVAPHLQMQNPVNYASIMQLSSALPSNAPGVVRTEEATLSALEGVYLKGRGIVYTATLSSLQLIAKAEAAKKPISEWESVRQQVRNEKEKPKKPEASKPPALSDVLLKVLAENGHNLSQLGDNERLTIVLTVHDASPSPPPAKSEEGSAKPQSKSAANGGDSDLRSQVRDLELLGELHLKQGKHEEAIAAFRKELKLISNPKHEAELHRKLAQCYLMQGQDEKARAELDQALALRKKEAEAKEKPTPAVKPAPALPLKLIISAPKKLLDQVKKGQITFEEFRRQAHVETLRFGDRR